MRRVQTYFYTIDIDTPEDQLGLIKPLFDANNDLADAYSALADPYTGLLSPFNQDCRAALPDYVQPSNIQIDTNNSAYPFTLDPQMMAIQNSLPFDKSLQQQSSYNGDMAADIMPELAPLTSLGIGLENPDTWGIDQQIPDQVLAFAQNPPTTPGSDDDFWSYLKKLSSAMEALTKAKIIQRDILKQVIQLINKPVASRAFAFSDMNSRLNATSLIKYKGAMEGFFLDGKMPSLSWIKLPTTPTTPTIPPIPQAPKVPNLLGGH